MSLDLVDVRCVKCKHLLARMERDAVREHRVIEWKCSSCGAFRTEMGRAEGLTPSGHGEAKSPASR